MKVMTLMVRLSMDRAHRKWKETGDRQYFMISVLLSLIINVMNDPIVLTAYFNATKPMLADLLKRFGVTGDPFRHIQN